MRTGCKACSVGRGRPGRGAAPHSSCCGAAMRSRSPCPDQRSTIIAPQSARRDALTGLMYVRPSRRWSATSTLGAPRRCVGGAGAQCPRGHPARRQLPLCEVGRCTPYKACTLRRHPLAVDGIRHPSNLLVEQGQRRHAWHFRLQCLVPYDAIPGHQCCTGARPAPTVPLTL